MAALHPPESIHTQSTACFALLHALNSFACFTCIGQLVSALRLSRHNDKALVAGNPAGLHCTL